MCDRASDGNPYLESPPTSCPRLRMPSGRGVDAEQDESRPGDTCRMFRARMLQCKAPRCALPEMLEDARQLRRVSAGKRCWAALD